jgi:pantoate--beta-alanine ligase
VETITTADRMTALVSDWRRGGLSIGFVPTMGALHRGHMSLVDISTGRADRTVVSIFVNPTQFSEGEDLDRYPVTLDEDGARLREAGVDALFLPGREEVYPGGFSTRVEVDGLTEGLCGAFRPGHFDGVTTVCAVLFGIVRPDFAVFGRKDAQQLAVVRRMVRDLRLGIGIVEGGIVRESDGLAMSSRNRYLSPLQREEAAGIYQGLLRVRRAFEEGVRGAGELEEAFRSETGTRPGLRVQYANLVDPDTMEGLGYAGDGSLFAVAVFSGDTRLIDNILLEKRSGSVEV